MPLPQSLTWAHLRNTHPEHCPGYWRQLRALASGGQRLLQDKVAMADLFPQHPHEEAAVFEARRARAFHIPYPGEIVGDLVGQLAQDPPTATADPNADEWYGKVFFDNVDRKGLTLLGYAQAMLREALTTRVAWALVEMPAKPEAGAVQTLAEQEAAGLLRAYVCPLPTESVIDWEEDEDSNLVWACVHTLRRRRPDPGARRDKVTAVFTFYDAAGWVRFEVTYDPEKGTPKDTDTFSVVDSGDHSFGAVPVLRLALPEGLWAMDKMFGPARAHFQQRSAFSYAQVRGLFPILTAYLGPEMGGGGAVPSEAQQSPDRATRQTYGVGYVAAFGKDDRLEYTAPPSDVYTVAAKDLDVLRDEMHRVCAAMASAMDNNAATVGRSGASKAMDKHAKELVLQHVGTMLCDHLRDVLAMVSEGRGEACTWAVSGFRVFDQVTGSEAADSATIVLGLNIPSPTFKRVFLTATAKRIVAHDATPEQLEEIAEEIENNVSDEEFDPLPPPGTQPPGGPPVVNGVPQVQGGGQPPESMPPPPKNTPRGRSPKNTPRARA